MKTRRSKLTDWINIVWTLAWRDIFDSIKNRTVLGLIITLCVIMLMPKLMSIMFVQPAKTLPVFDQGNPDIVEILANDPEFDVVRLKSMEEMSALLNNSLHADIALVVPDDISLAMGTGEPLVLQGYSTWEKRLRVQDAAEKLEDRITQMMGQVVDIQVDGNFIFPPEEMGVMLGMVTITAVTIIFTMGLILVPNLLFEEKQTKTLHALLISPASIGQVVWGKAIAGMFNIIVTAALVFLFNWTAVVHWEIVILFAIANGIFGVAVGLVLGSFFESQQEVVALTTLIMLLFIGALFIHLIQVDVPPIIETIIPWVPSIGLANISHMAYTQSYAINVIWENLISTIVLSVILYALTVWKIKRSDV